MTNSVRLLPGLRLVRRDADHLQLGVDPPRRAVLRDLPEVRRLVAELAIGHRPADPSPEVGRALAAIACAGLLVPDDAADRRARRFARPIGVQAPPEVSAGVSSLLQAAGARTVGQRESPHVVLLVTEGEVPRDRLDVMAREDLPHLLVREHPDEVVVGPFVAPGLTACLRCVDCHLGDLDPRRGLVVEQVANQEPIVSAPVDVALRSVALSLAVRDLVSFAEGCEPATWSATISVTKQLDLAPRRWLRHPACGCAWDELLSAG